MPQKIAVITSGGDVPGLNACIRAIVHAAHHHGIAVTGVRHGYDGLMNGELQDMTMENVHDIMQRVAQFCIPRAARVLKPLQGDSVQQRR